jgi:hypothetical protein
MWHEWGRRGTCIGYWSGALSVLGLATGGVQRFLLFSCQRMDDCPQGANAVTVLSAVIPL